MIGLDTNILVRYLTQDDPKQSQAATRLIETELSARQPGFITLVVLVEVYWVLERLYGAQPAEIVDALADMLDVAHWQFQERACVQAALEDWRKVQTSKAKQVQPQLQPRLPDILIAHLARKFGCQRIVSFDKAAVRSAGMSLLV